MIDPKGRRRAGGTPVARGEFSIVIAALAVTAGIAPSLGSLATAYVLILVPLGPLTARLMEPLATRLLERLRRQPAIEPQDITRSPSNAHETLDDQDAVGHT